MGGPSPTFGDKGPLDCYSPSLLPCGICVNYKAVIFARYGTLSDHSGITGEYEQVSWAAELLTKTKWAWTRVMQDQNVNYGWKESTFPCRHNVCKESRQSFFVFSELDVRFCLCLGRVERRLTLMAFLKAIPLYMLSQIWLCMKCIKIFWLSFLQKLFWSLFSLSLSVLSFFDCKVFYQFAIIVLERKSQSIINARASRRNFAILFSAGRKTLAQIWNLMGI